jgi:hypothetical protein
LIGIDIEKRVGNTAGPPDLQSFSVAREAHAEVDAEIVLGQITRSGADLPDESLPSNEEFQASADTVAIALRAEGPDEKVVCTVAAIVAKQVHGLSHVADQNVEVSVVVDISGRECAARLEHGKAGTRHRPSIGEPS